MFNIETHIQDVSSLKMIFTSPYFFPLMQNRIPRYSGENLEKNKPVYARLEELAVMFNCTTSQLALAWLLHQGDDIVPIPGKFFFLLVYSFET